MRFCSITMAGPNDNPQQAIKTVRDIVDESLVTLPGEIRDFAAARNEALEFAVAKGFDYALMLDCDERIQCVNPKRLRTVLASNVSADVYIAMDLDRFYAKDRIFRLPPRGQYVGPTHEMFVYDDVTRREMLSGLTFHELPRTPEQTERKLARDLQILECYTAEHPHDARFWYYLGDTYEQSNYRDLAIVAFERSHDLNSTGEESPWSAYRIATFLAGEAKHAEAIVWCLKGMAQHAAMAELHWLAGWCCYQMGRDHQAVYWSVLSSTFGEFSNRRYPVQRIGFRTPQALWEWPYETLRNALHRLGDVAGANDADVLYNAAKKKRESQ